MADLAGGNLQQTIRSPLPERFRPAAQFDGMADVLRALLGQIERSAAISMLGR